MDEYEGKDKQGKRKEKSHEYERKKEVNSKDQKISLIEKHHESEGKSKGEKEVYRKIPKLKVEEICKCGKPIQQQIKTMRINKTFKDGHQ